MPLYEYVCEACGSHFELIRKFSDPPVDTCFSCGGAPVRKLLSSPAIRFKGTGWYVTDYPKKDRGKPEGEPAAGSSAKSDSAASESSSSSSSTPDSSSSSKPANSDSKS
jgi:putative FmdB family regulatory protein